MFHTRTTDKYFDAGMARISKVVKSFVPMPTTDFMSLPPGLCIEHGVVTGSEFGVKVSL
jgi:hypothetical protein